VIDGVTGGVAGRENRDRAARAGVVISGDALITGHLTSPVSGPQLLPRWFDHDRGAAAESLRIIGELDADILLPGHGPIHHGSVAEAAATARERVGATP